MRDDELIRSAETGNRYVLGSFQNTLSTTLGVEPIKYISLYEFFPIRFIKRIELKE
jgi:hypothetical protein